VAFLLTGHAEDTDTHLDNIRADLLDLEIGEDIRPHFHQNCLVISARRPTISAILNQIDMVVQSRVSRKVAVGHIRQTDLQRDVLRALERITGTALELDYKNKSSVRLCHAVY
jgi:hypothetical protein